MKRIMASLLLIALLLCGCTKRDDVKAPPISTTGHSTSPEKPIIGNDYGIYMDESPIERSTSGAVKQFIPGGSDYYGIANMGQYLLLFSGTEFTTMTRLANGGMPISVTLDCLLDPYSDQVRIDEDTLRYFDTEDQTIVTMNNQLNEISRMTLPDDTSCAPVISMDGQYLYYFTTDALRSLEIATVISRLLRQSKGDDQYIIRSHFEGKMLECVVESDGLKETVYVSTATGEALSSHREETELASAGEVYYAKLKQVDRWYTLFGKVGEDFLCLKPQWDGTEHLVLNHSAVTISENTDDGARIAYYELSGGTSPYSVVLPGLQNIAAITGDQNAHYLWFFATDVASGRQNLYCWDPALTPTKDNTAWLEPFYTAESPDTEGLADCDSRVKILEEHYGVRIRIWQEAANMIPENYSVEPEHVVAAYLRDLPMLEKVMSAYPAEMLKKLGKQSSCGKLTICLVRNVYESNALGVKEQESGVFFRDGGNAYVVLSMGEGLEQAAYHELFHAIDSYVITQCNAYDFWGDLNPTGFDYDYSYITNAQRDGTEYLKEENRSFIDTYSMSFPMEDRARVMEYAMMEGNEVYFISKTMQTKLKLLCLGIRTAFKMDKYEEPLVWEQYIK
jgi:hypothetical protein